MVGYNSSRKSSTISIVEVMPLCGNLNYTVIHSQNEVKNRDALEGQLMFGLVLWGKSVFLLLHCNQLIPTRLFPSMCVDDSC